MNGLLSQISNSLYKKNSLEISDFEIEKESKEYDACRFQLNGKKVICRNSKITPKKVGQFVTFWKRNGNGPIEPFHEADDFDFFIVNVQQENQIGQFVFPKQILVQKGIISTIAKEGKRAFRVYPKKDIDLNKQAERSQKWQLDYFIDINDSIHSTKVLP